MLSTLLESLTEEILGRVFFLSTSSAVWAALEAMFASQINGGTMQIKIQLANLKKKDMTMAAYFQKMKGLAYHIAFAGRPMHEEEIVSYILTGLGIDYDSVVTSVSARSDPMGLNELYAHLINYELCIEQN